MPELFAVVGNPVERSLSPLIHNRWYELLRIDAVYERRRVENGERLRDIAAEFYEAGYRGFNVTIPLKGAAFHLAEDHDKVAAATKAVNTMIRGENSWRGINTDVFGITASLDKADKDWRVDNNEKAVIIGAGGAAAAALYALRNYKKVVVVNRTVANAERLAETVGVDAEVYPLARMSDALSSASLVINAASQNADFSRLDLARVAAGALAFDFVYTTRTEFSRRAKESGLRLIPGVMLLLHQAAAAFAAWFSTTPPVDENIFADLLSSPNEGDRA